MNVDLVVRAAALPGPGETVTGGTFARSGGGKGANQAVAAARAGAAVRMVGAVGDDDFGTSAREELAAEGIDVAGVVVLEGEATGVALIAVDARGENQIAVASGANAALGAEHVRAALAGPTSVLLLGHEVSDGVLAAAAAWAREAGARVILDPAPARPVAAAVLAAHPLLTPNAGEAEALTGHADPAQAAAALTARTRAPVLVTLGPDGVLLHDDDTSERLPAPRADVVDTTGAGDVFAGALAAALAQGTALPDAVAAAQRAAARATERPGAR